MAITSIPILTFHAMDDDGTTLSFSPHTFERGIVRLAESGYNVLALGEIAARLHRRASLPERALVLTFDDGYRSIYDHAFPILRLWQMPATVFLTVGRDQTDRLPSLGGRELLSWNEIREMSKSGIEFGAHTLTHPDLTRLAAPEIETEIHESKVRIEQMLGAEVSSFAYPFGHFNLLSRAIAQKYYACAVTDRLGWARGDSDPFTLKRLDAYYLQNEKFFGALSARWFRGYIFARGIPRNLRRVRVTG